MKSDVGPGWDGAAVHLWLESRIAAARANQVTAERAGRDGQDDCDSAAAEEMVCTSLKTAGIVESQSSFLAAAKALLDRDDYLWRGVYDDRRFDRRARTYLRKVIRMAKTNTGFERLSRYQ